MFRAFFVKAPDIPASRCPALAPIPMPDPTCAPDVTSLANSVLHPTSDCDHDPAHAHTPDVGGLASSNAAHVLGPTLAPAHNPEAKSVSTQTHTQVTNNTPVPAP
jgi:hypothetical protein